MTEPSASYSSPTLLDAAWRYKWLVLFVALGFAGLAWLYANNSESWTAEATLAVQDPRSSNIFDQGGQDAPERYVEGQVAILQSRSVATRAAELAAEQSPPIDVTAKDIIDDLGVDGSGSSDIVTLSYTAPTKREAIGVVNAVAAAYQDIGRAAADKTFQDAVAEIDRSIADLQSEISVIERQLADRQRAALAALDQDPTRNENLALLDELNAQLNELEPPSSTASVGRFNQFNSQVDILTLRIATVTAALNQQRDDTLELEREDPDRVALEKAQGEAQNRLTDLQLRRDQLAVDADLASSGVVFFSPAETAEPQGTAMFIVIGALFGLVVGVALAVPLANRRRRFEHRNEPEALLRVRLLADVPSFKEERLSTPLPVTDAPTSVAAEAFRFVAASVSLQQKWPVQEGKDHNFKSVIAVSAGLSEGKTIVTANTAFAAASGGQRVLLVDADFGNQQLTEMMLAGAQHPMGMTDIVAGKTTLQDAVVHFSGDGVGPVGLLSRGTSAVQAPDFFAAHKTAELFEEIKENYDLILIDAPPLLRVAYARTLARLADIGMVIVPHGGDMHVTQELKDQIDLVGIPVIGYVYNFAPLRPEMTLSAGSMADTLGEFPASAAKGR